MCGFNLVRDTIICDNSHVSMLGCIVQKVAIFKVLESLSSLLVVEVNVNYVLEGRFDSTLRK